MSPLDEAQEFLAFHRDDESNGQVRSIFVLPAIPKMIQIARGAD